MIYTLIWISLLVIILNIPFGYWRINVKKYAWQWMLAVHIPVPFVILLRVYCSIGFAWYTYLFLVTAFFIGQQFAGRLQLLMKRNCKDVTSCMVIDLFRYLNN